MKTMIPGDFYRIPHLDGEYEYVPVVREVKGEKVALLVVQKVGTDEPGS